MKNSIILFDGICNLCNSSIQFIIKHDKNNTFKFSSLQSEFGQNFLKERNLSTDQLYSIILFEPGKAYYDKSTAILKIAQKLKSPYSWAYIFIFIPSSIRNFIYTIIAKNRYQWFGKKEFCMVPTPELKEKFID